VVNYAVYYDQGLGMDTLLDSAVSTQYYTTTVPLTPDSIYTFKVTAANSVGSSLMSDPVSIRAAELADAPIDLTNVPEITTAYQIGLDWNEGTYNGGSPVTDYRVSYKISTDSVYTEYESGVLLT
jgi:hypothetical protein